MATLRYLRWDSKLRDLLALRAGGPWHFELSAMQGIVTMPSYHTVMAVLFTYAFRRTGLVGYGIATLNLVMLLSIPPIGGHYLVDMLAGGALALGAIAVQRAPRHGVSRILFGLRRETLVGKVLDSARGFVFKPERISARALAAKAGRLHDARDGGNLAGCIQLTEDKTLLNIGSQLNASVSIIMPETRIAVSHSLLRHALRHTRKRGSDGIRISAKVELLPCTSILARRELVSPPVFPERR